MSVNLSAMTDEEVVAMHRKIKTVICKEKGVGRQKAVAVEATRYFIYRVYNKIAKKLVDRLPEKQPFKLIKKIYHESHNAVQFLFDKLRLYLLDVK